MIKGNILIGAGILDIEYMKSYDSRMYSAYERINSHIEEFRIVANNYYENIYNKDSKSIAKQIKPNNTISIIGDRGVGKTSLMLTLLNELQWQKEGEDEKIENIILPIIDPEKFNAEKNALGWVIFCFEEIIDRFCEDKRNFCTDKQKDFEELKAIYNELKKTYINSRESSRIEMTGFISGSSEYTKIAERVIFSDMILARKTEDFINKFICYVKNNNKDKKQPLIVITFDDIDLCPEHGIKIMNTILEYLSHPAIVTIVLGKIENFITGIENDITKTGKVYELESDRKENRQKANKTTIEILKKGLPPFFRNYIKKLSHQEIMDFIPFGDKKIYKNTFKEKIRQVKLNKLTKSCLNDYFEPENSIVFMKSNHTIKNYIMKFVDSTKGVYENILPQKPRDAINFYFLMEQIKEGKNEFESFVVLYDYFYNILEHKKGNLNYLDEIFQLDRTKKEVKIRNKFNNIIFYVGKIENYIEDDNVNDNYWIKDVMRFIEELNDGGRSHISEEFFYLYKKGLRNWTRMRNAGIFDIVLEMISNRNYNEKGYFKEFEYEFEKISRRYYERLDFSSRDAESEEEVDAKYSMNLILLTMNRVFDNTKLYFSRKVSSDELKTRSEIEKELVKEIKDDISIIKNEIIKLEKTIVNANSEGKRKNRERERLEKETIKVIKCGSSNIKFYDEFWKIEVDEEDGMVIQFLFDIATEMGLISSNIIAEKMKKVTDTMIKRIGYSLRSKMFSPENKIEKFINYYNYTIIEENQSVIAGEIEKEEMLKNIQVKIKSKGEEKNKLQVNRNLANIDENKNVEKVIKDLETEIKKLETKENNLNKEIEGIKFEYEERENKIKKIELEIKNRK